MAFCNALFVLDCKLDEGRAMSVLFKVVTLALSTVSGMEKMLDVFVEVNLRVWAWVNICYYDIIFSCLLWSITHVQRSAQNTNVQLSELRRVNPCITTPRSVKRSIIVCFQLLPPPSFQKLHCSDFLHYPLWPEQAAKSTAQPFITSYGIRRHGSGKCQAQLSVSLSSPESWSLFSLPSLEDHNILNQSTEVV